MSPLARRPDGRRTARTARRRWGRRTLSARAAGRLLDGGDDGPGPLSRLLAAAAAPGTAAELQGEDTARAAFRSSAHATAPLGSRRRAAARSAAAIVTTKVVATLALTAGTAGGVALVAHSSSVQLQPAVGGVETATVRDVSPSSTTTSSTVSATRAPDGVPRSGGSAGRDETGPDGAGRDEAESGAGVPSPGAAARPAAPTVRCAAPCTTTEDRSAPSSGQPGGPPVEPAKEDNGNGSGTQNPRHGEGPDPAKDTNNGNAFGKEKNGGGSGSAGTKNGNGERKGVEKGAGEKKSDAATIANP